jgi:hypothetical protein
MFKPDSIMDDDNNARTGLLIPVLQDNSVEYHYLPDESLEIIDGNTHTGLVILTN